MKVIVQDLESGAYLSTDGRWVVAASDARDFVTLWRAYHFAKDNTSRHFQVLLHCPEDKYTAGIIDGKGTAIANAEAAVIPVKAQATLRCEVPIFHRRNLGRHANRFNWTRSDLN